MKRFAQKNRHLPIKSSLPSYLAVAAIALFALGLVTGCGSNRSAVNDDGSEIADTDVQATVEVAVAATVSAIDGLGEASTNVEDDNVEASRAEDENDEPEALDEQAQLMQWVTTNTRHYIGDPNAPVVFIEFSDFQ